MKVRIGSILFLCLILACASACADKAPAVEQLGSKAAAEHLMTHIYAYTDGWDGYGPVPCTDEGCEEYGHVHCYGRRVSLWDTPKKGKKTVPYYPGNMSARVGPDTEFQLVDVVSYKNGYYAGIRILNENGNVVYSGYMNADYVGCDCESYEAGEAVPDYEYDFGPFDLR